MKNIVKYTIAVACALTVGISGFGADNKDATEAVKLTKTLTPNGDGTYKIHLESYVTGASVTTFTKTTKPCDIVLCLDVSGSMAWDAIASKEKVASGTRLDNVNDKYIVEIEGKTYYLRRRNNTWYYYSRSEDDDQDFNRIAQYSSLTNYTVGESDKIYTYTEDTRINILKSAVKAFVSEVYSRSCGEDGRAETTSDNVANRISIVTFSPSSNFTSSDYTDYDKNNSSGSRRGAKILTINNTKGLVDVISNNNAINTAIDGLKASGATVSSSSLAHANTLLSGTDNSRNKVVVMFTDGVPGVSGWDSSVARDALAAAKTLKDGGTKVFSVGIFNTSQDNYTNNRIPNYMNGVSSNYPAASATGNITFNLGTRNSDGVEYMQISDGANLSEIFEDIAQSSATDGGESIELGSTNSYVQDVMSANFSLPEGITADKIKVWVEKCTGIAADGNYNFAKYTDAYPAYNVGTLTPEVDEENGTVTVKGYNFSLDDEWNKDSNGNNTTIKNSGNWVGPRKIGNQPYYYGNKLCIEFDVIVNPDYEGGYGVPSNDMVSGIYSIKTDDQGHETETMVKPFEVPSADFPSICILKEGLNVGESAIFRVEGLGEEKTIFNVVLTQRETANGDKYPCYAVLKGITGGQAWKVTETNWSWTYALEEGSTKEITRTLYDLESAGTTKEAIAAGEDLSVNDITMGKYLTLGSGSASGYDYAIIRKQETTGVFEEITEDSPATKGAVVVLYRFNNKKSTSGLPARGEAYAHNKFAGGTAKTGGTETGGNEEEDI